MGNMSKRLLHHVLSITEMDVKIIRTSNSNSLHQNQEESGVWAVESNKIREDSIDLLLFY